jgi:prevent-host-death family protein
MKPAQHEQSVGAFAAKTHLSRYLADAQRGIVTVVTVRGRPAAKIVPPDAELSLRPRRIEDLIRSARAIRARGRRGRESLHALINAGRR